MKTPQELIADLLKAQSAQVIENAQAQVASALVGAEDGQLTVTIAFKLTLAKGNVHAKTRIKVPSEAFVVEGEDSTEIDANQIKLGI